MVNHLHDAGGIALAGTNGTEQRVSYRHHQRRGHALAAGIANAEEELVIAQEEVVDVASHLAGGNQSAGNVDIAMAQVLVGQHVALDALGHLELTVDAHALVLVFYQALVVLEETIDDISQQGKAHEHEKEYLEPQPHQLAKHLIVVAHHRHLPVRLALHVVEEHTRILTILGNKLYNIDFAVGHHTLW